MVTQDGDTELSLVLSGCRVTAHDETSREIIQKTKSPIRPAGVFPYTLLYINPSSLYMELPNIRWIISVVFLSTISSVFCVRVCEGMLVFRSMPVFV